MSQNPNQSQNPKDSQSLSQSLKSGISGTELSVGARKKLTQDDIKFAKLDTDVKELLGSVVGLTVMLGSGMKRIDVIADGVFIGKHIDPYAKSLVELAKKYEWMYNFLNTICQTGVWGEFIAQTATLIVGIATIHGMSLPEQVPGVVEGKEALQETTMIVQAAQLQQAA